MDAKTLKALKGSIEKWKKIEGSTRGKDKGHTNCPLCTLYFHLSCDGCPVFSKTTYRQCNTTPYIEWIDHHLFEHEDNEDLHRIKDCPTCLELATKEREFLESLLPKKDNS